ncbi:MAG: hypothetical protein LBQ86_02330 [Holophagales bacterium]|jgi:hypothetical protein|nr:hypothetical protein [Holophagales bacterium]
MFRASSAVKLFCLVLFLAIPLRSQEFEAQAVAGEPFGVCAVKRPLNSTEQELYAGRNRKTGYQAIYEFVSSTFSEILQQAGDRALYPAWTLRGLIDWEEEFDPEEIYSERSEWSLSDAGGTNSVVLFFLFKGREELNIKFSGVLGEDDRELKVKPIIDAGLHKSLLEKWWGAYIDRIEVIKTLDIYEPTAELGIAAIMKRRLGLEGKLPYSEYRRKSDFDDAFALLLGTESIRLAMQAETLLNTRDKAALANQPLPEAVAPPEMPVPDFNDSLVSVEPIAMRVPKECFYIRFGSFPDFLETKDFIDRWGVLFRSLLSSRSADFEMIQKVERQLALKESFLSKYFGGTVIKDVAVIGADPFIREGATMGVLFHARQSGLLKGHLESLRKDVMKSDSDINETTVEIAGRRVSLASTPGNTVRSFYVQDGDFHLVTNSRWIVEKFLETNSRSKNALGGLKEFRYARSKLSASEKGVFVYLSDPFFRNLVGPKYRVEMARRANSIIETQMLALVRMVAEQEGVAYSDIDSLIKSGLLPDGFGLRPDSSGLIMQNKLIMDSLRGSVGSLLPIADVVIEGATKEEVHAYEAFSDAYEGLWTNMDPVYGNLKTTKDNDGERLELTLNISPYARSRYDFFLQFLGQPLKDRIALVPGTLFSAEIRPRESYLGLFSEGLDENDEDDEDDEDSDDAPILTRPGPRAIDLETPYAMRLFAGLRDFEAPFEVVAGNVVRADKLLPYAGERLIGYAGGVIPQGLDINTDLFLSGSSKADSEGYFMLEENFRRKGKDKPENQIWGRKFNSFLMLATGRTLLETVSSNIRIEKAEQPAQLRVTLGDFSNAETGKFMRAELYARERRISAGGALQLQAIQQQLRHKDADLAIKEIQDKITVCPLGGKYVRDSKLPGSWKSTAWREPALFDVNQIPESYRHPFLDGMKWLRLDFAIDPNTLNTRLEIQTKESKRQERL